jgi:DNA-nicking Smr family endonuclease
MRRPRGLRPEERALWDMVADRTDPLHTKKPSLAVHDPAARKKPTRTPQKIAPFTLGIKATPFQLQDNLITPLTERLATAPVQMDRKSFKKLSRGKLQPEGRLDLHGLTMAEAHPDLVAFISNAHIMQKRLVLVITGKGKNKPDLGPIPTRRGVLKHQVPQWLSLPPIAHLVLEVREAHLKHGGGGAYYVYLRRSR